jgi:signal transduction histidine kinase
MSFRTRLMLTFLFAVLLPLVILGLAVRHEMTKRLTAQYERRVESLVSVIEEGLAGQRAGIRSALAGVCDAMAADNRFRRATLDGSADERRYLLDYAGSAMRLAGLDMLQVQDESGRILTSGHFRNDFDRVEPGLARLVSSTTDGTALVGARAPDGPFLALVRADSVRMGERRFDVVGGVRVESRFLGSLAPDDDVAVAVRYPGAEPDSASAARRGGIVARGIDVPFIDAPAGRVEAARFRVTLDTGELAALRRSVDRWFLAAVLAAALLAVVVAGALSSRLSAPLAELADKTSRVDLDRLDVDFDSRRGDEIGALARMLAAMTERLRASAAHIRDAERRATVGELARQVNHDIKNGLTPIRNVFRHLTELARDEPARLPQVFDERRGTLDESIAYLETLATNYAGVTRVAPRGERRACDVNEIVRGVAAGFAGFACAGAAAALRMNLCERAVSLGDPLSLRRIVENLVDNAIDSLGAGGGTVTISTTIAADGDRACVHIDVVDTGSGMSEDEQRRIFDDFYTTKADGTGLGLSIVRRLVMDMGGTVRVESEPGAGSRFIVELPGATG